MASETSTRDFVSLGMFIIDEFSFADENGNPTGKTQAAQVSPRILMTTHTILRTPLGMVADRGRRHLRLYRRTDMVLPTLSKFSSWTGSDLHFTRRLPPSKLGMIIDRGNDFPAHIQEALDSYGPDMWLYRDNPNRSTTRAINSYRGEFRGYVSYHAIV